jgi:hypothetical protein
MRAGFVLGMGRKLALREEEDEEDEDEDEDELKDVSVRLSNFVAYTDLFDLSVTRTSKTPPKPHTSS